MKKKDTILIVDDTKTNIDILIDLLENYDVVVAMDGQSAINILEEDSNIDLILLDIMMPEMDGFEVCKIIKTKKNIQDIPIIFITAKTDDNSIQKGFGLGGVDYITKPFRPIELLARVKTHLDLVKHEKKEIEHNKFIALKELIHNISHQWRQPLSVIATTSSGMIMKKEMEILEDKDFYNSCNIITDITQQLSNTIDNFQTLIGERKHKSIFNLKTLIENNYNLLFNDHDNIKGIIEIDDNININGLQNKLLEALIHMINNSRYALEDLNIEDKTIFLNSNIKGDKIILELYDNAKGLHKDNINKVFEPYFTTQHQTDGKGLGLYTVYKTITESFNGMIDVTNIEFNYNNKKHKGAKFEIQIPIS